MYKYLLHHYFLESVQRYPDKIALVMEDAWTYQTLFQAIKHTIHHFSKNGIEYQHRVVLQMPHSVELVTSYWALMMLGVTITIFPEEIETDELNHRMNDLMPHFRITVKNKNLTVKAISNESKNKVIKIPISCDLAMIIYTSGSTGKPKGIMLSHDNMISAMKSISDYLTINHQDCIINFLPFHFDYGLYQMILAFCNGATLVLEKSFTTMDTLYYKIRKHGVTIFPLVPTIVQFFKYSKIDTKQLTSLKKITNTGERLTEQAINYILELFPQAQLYSMYGLTECKRCTYVPPDKLKQKMGSVGVPIPNLSLLLLSENKKAISASFKEGEIAVRAAAIMQGYWNNINATAEKIWVYQGQRYLLTGDRGYFDEDGYFYITGRKDHQIKVKGEKLNVLYYAKKIESIAGISRAHLFMRNFKLTVVYESAIQIDPKVIKQLFPVQLQPADIIQNNAFPVLANGKIDYITLKHCAGADVP